MMCKRCTCQTYLVVTLHRMALFKMPLRMAWSTINSTPQRFPSHQIGWTFAWENPVIIFFRGFLTTKYMVLTTQDNT